MYLSDKTITGNMKLSIWRRIKLNQSLNTFKEFSGKSNGGASVMHFTICAGLAYGRLVCYGLCQICYIGNVYH